MNLSMLPGFYGKRLRAPEGGEGGSGGGENKPPEGGEQKPPEGDKPELDKDEAIRLDITKKVLDERMARVSKATLRELAKEHGFTDNAGRGDVDAYKAAIAKWKTDAAEAEKRREAEKSELERLTEQAATLQAERDRLEKEREDASITIAVMKSATVTGINPNAIEEAELLYKHHKLTSDEPMEAKEFFESLKEKKPYLFSQPELATTGPAENGQGKQKTGGQKKNALEMTPEEYAKWSREHGV